MCVSWTQGCGECVACGAKSYVTSVWLVVPNPVKSNIYATTHEAITNLLFCPRKSARPNPTPLDTFLINRSILLATMPIKPHSKSNPTDSNELERLECSTRWGDRDGHL
eukprot:482521_1